MRTRSLAVILGVFGAAALVSTFVVRQLPREGQLSGTPSAPLPPAPPPVSAEDTPSTEADGLAVVRVTAGGEPQAGAEVQLYRAVFGAEPGWRRGSSARSGADGIARVPARAGAWLATVRAPGLAPGAVELVRAPREDATRVEAALAPGASLEGVVRAGGRPVEAQVRLVPSAAVRLGVALGAPAEETPALRADAGGRFRVDGLAPGLWTVEVVAAGQHPARVERVAVPRAAPLEVSLDTLASLSGEALLPGGRAAAGVTVRAVSREHVASSTTDASGRFALAVPGGEYALLATQGSAAGALDGVTVAPGATARGLAVHLAPAAALDGLAARAGGAPAADADVAVTRHGTGGVVARARAAADGSFAVAGLAPGSYDVRVAAAGASPALLAGVTLGAGQRFPLRAELPALGSIEGTVADPAGRPLSGATVAVVSRGDGLDGVPPLEARSDFEGRYRLEGVEVGRAELVACESGVPLGDARAVRVAPGQAARADFFVPPAGALAGKVTRAGAKPPLGTAVIAVPLRGGSGTAQVARTLADASGHYGLVLPAGEYRVLAAPADAASIDLRAQPAFVRIDPRLTARADLPVATVAADEGVEVVVVEPGGAPSAGAIVTVSRADDAKIALALTAGEDGRVRLGPELRPGGPAITIRARNGGRSGAVTGPLPASGGLLVTLAPGGALDGVIRTGGRAVKSFTLEVTSQPTPEGWRTVDVHRFAGDRFTLGDVPVEPVRLSVRTDDGRRGEALVRLAAGESRGVEITLAGSPARR
jgi:hypothetical protein